MLLSLVWIKLFINLLENNLIKCQKHNLCSLVGTLVSLIKVKENSAKKMYDFISVEEMRKMA